MGACTEERSLRCPMCLCALLCKSASLHAGGSVWGWVGPSVSHYSSSVLSSLQFLFLLLALACGVNTGSLKVHRTQCPISDDKIGPHWKKFLQVQVLFSPAFHLSPCWATTSILKIHYIRWINSGFWCRCYINSAQLMVLPMLQGAVLSETLGSSLLLRHLGISGSCILLSHS